MESTSHVVAVLLLSILLCSHQTQAEEIKRTCENAVNEELCISSLKSIPGSDKANLTALSAMAINLAITNGTAVSRNIKQMVAQTTDAADKTRLESCSKNYETALSKMKDAFNILPSKAFNDVLTNIEAAMIETEVCRDGLAEKKPSQSNIVKDQNAVFQQLCGNALSSVNVLAGI